ncbi:MAG TPA: SRPBCC domain-containing protein [Candidatus Dormibacteraeota bacterium]
MSSISARRSSSRRPAYSVDSPLSLVARMLAPLWKERRGIAGLCVLLQPTCDPTPGVVLTWGWERTETVPPGSTTVEITLAPEGSGTLFRLRHLGLPSEEERKNHRTGWTMYSERLAALFSGAR